MASGDDVTTMRVLCPEWPLLDEVRDVLDDLAPRCRSCDGAGAQQERQTCLACDGRGVDYGALGVAATLETLVARGLLPPAAIGDAGRAFVASSVFGSGEVATSRDPRTGDVTVTVGIAGTTRSYVVRWASLVGCESITAQIAGAVAGVLDTWPHPPRAQALVAWAALGWPAIRAAEEIARETAARMWAGRTAPRIVWRAIERAEYLKSSRRRARGWSAGDVPGILASIVSDHAVVATVRAHWGAAARCGLLHAAEEATSAAALSLLEMGLALDVVTEERVVIAVPLP